MNYKLKINRQAILNYQGRIFEVSPSIVTGLFMLENSGGIMVKIEDWRNAYSLHGIGGI
jgi:hypothetical protein